MRFYFRALELLAPNCKPGLSWRVCYPAMPEGPNVIRDFLILDSCFRGIEDMQLWVLREMFGPGGFGMTARPNSVVLEALLREFPDCGWDSNDVSVSSQQALAKFEEHLRIARFL